MNESIETINYKNYRIELSYDTYSDSPNEWGNSTVAIFDSGYRGELNNTTRDEFYDDNDNLLIGVRSQLRAGTAYAVGVRHYSSSDGGFYTLLDDAKGTIDRLPLIHDAAYAKAAGAYHG